MDHAAALVITALIACVLWLVGRRHRVKVIAVIDGDTLFIVTSRGRRHRLRLKGIDSPETGQPGAGAAKAALSDLALNQWVTVRWHGHDRYRRRLATVYARGSNVAGVLLSRGLVFPSASGGMHWRSIAPRLLGRGVWKLGQPRPEASLRRRWRWWGLLQRQREARTRKNRKR